MESSQPTIKEGYKQTDVGIIPEDWEVKPLKKISPRQSVGLVINPSSYYDDDGTVPLLVGSNITENKIDWESAQRISEASNRLIAASRLEAGDLVTVRVGEPGITAVVPPELDGCNCASMMIVRQHPSFHSHWLCHVMNSRIGLAQVEHVQYGTAQKQFNISDAVNFSYPVPPLPEQQAIAEVLGDVDALITSLDQLITKKRNIKQGTMQLLLTGKKRLAGFSSDWKVIMLGERLRFQVGYPFSSEFFNQKDSGIRLVKNRDLKNDDQVFFYSGEYSRDYLIDDDDVLIGMDGDFLPCLWKKGTALLNQRVGRIIVLDKMDLGFTYYCLIKPLKEIEYGTASTTVKHLSHSDIEEIRMAIPELSEQKAIARILGDMDAEIQALEKKREKYKGIKQGMMQELLTGKMRLVSKS
ncbi:MAG TPA: restriction endonuclease subunit S [Pyrinomonadaceae bacterium]|jgi:type I restriction enzyme S subunit